MQRRAFLQMAPFGAASLMAAPAVNKRERMMQWVAGKPALGYTPAAFFLHFGPDYKNGTAAAKRHLEFFKQTDMDFVKVQFEQTYERQAFLQKPGDWARLKLQKIDFYEPLIVTVRELVKAAKKDSLILMTLYSPFMCAGHCATRPLLIQHLEEDPEAVKKGLEILTASQMIFVRACIRAGIDGFYMSTQGSEAKTWHDPATFTKYVKPFDLTAMKEIQAKCAFNILHVCDYVAPYADYNAVTDYPGHVINCNTRLTGGSISPQEIVKLFKKPYMGGMDRHGILAKGTSAQLEAEVKNVVKSAPRQFILGADCTVAGETDWNRLREAISVAHRVGA